MSNPDDSELDARVAGLKDLSEADEALFELLAEIEHQRWAKWQRYVHSVGIKTEDGSLLIPAGTVARWEEQIDTSYSALSEEEKNSNRRQVARYWSLVRR